MAETTWLLVLKFPSVVSAHYISLQNDNFLLRMWAKPICLRLRLTTPQKDKLSLKI